MVLSPKSDIIDMRHRPWYEKAKEVANLKGISYQDIANRVGVEKATVGHWMTGRNKARIEQVQQIAGILSMTVAELTGEDAYFVHDEQEREILESIRKAKTAEEKETIKRMIDAYLSSAPK